MDGKPAARVTPAANRFQFGAAGRAADADPGEGRKWNGQAETQPSLQSNGKVQQDHPDHRPNQHQADGGVPQRAVPNDAEYRPGEQHAKTCQVGRCCPGKA